MLSGNLAPPAGQEHSASLMTLTSGTTPRTEGATPTGFLHGWCGQGTPAGNKRWRRMRGAHNGRAKAQCLLLCFGRPASYGPIRGDNQFNSFSTRMPNMPPAVIVGSGASATKSMVIVWKHCLCWPLHGPLKTAQDCTLAHSRKQKRQAVNHVWWRGHRSPTSVTAVCVYCKFECVPE